MTAKQAEKQLNIFGLVGGIATAGLRVVTSVGELFELGNLIRTPVTITEAGSSGIVAITELTGIDAAAKGGINATKINNNSYAIIDLNNSEQKIVSQILSKGDQGGDLTEVLVESVSQRQGLKSLEGGKYNNNNGFDHVFQNADGTVTIVLDSKQLADGTVKLSSDGAGGTMQLSDEWIANVLGKLDRNSSAYKAVQNALDNGKLTKGVAAVDRVTGKLIILRIN